MRIVRTLVVAGLALGLMALFLRSADLDRVWTAMRTARLDGVLAGVALTAAVYVVRTLRWQLLLSPLGRVPFAPALRTTVIGFAASALLPARAGEVLRPLLLAGRTTVPATAAFATIVVERVLDLTAVLLLLGAYLVVADPAVAARAPRLAEAVMWGATVTIPAVLGLFGGMVVCARSPETVHRWLRSLARLLPARLAEGAATLARTFAEGLAVVRYPDRLAASVGLSLLMWMVIATQTWAVCRAFALGIPYGGSYLITAMLVVGIALPTPGGVGGFHEAFRLGATSFFGAPNDAAIGAALVLHAASFVPVVVFGLAFAFRDGLNMKGLQQLSATHHPSDAPSGASRGAA